MEVVIGKDDTRGHIINKYKFKVLASAESCEISRPSVNAEAQTVPHKGAFAEAPVSPKEEAARDVLVESLLKKTDDISSNFIKMQMKLESAEEEFKAQLETAKKEAFEEGVRAGLAQAESERKSAEAEGMAQFSASVKTLEQSAQAFQAGLEAIRQELLEAALDIAKEVIAVELEERSSAVAQTLSAQLIEELQGASKVTLRVNPVDYGPICENIGKLEHVVVVSDSAVSRGGVIAISDAGNIDAEIMKRYERVKRAALSG